MSRKVSRRDFARFLSHSAIAAAFGRALISERALGAVPGKNLVIFTHPNGHKNWQLTQNAVNSTGMGGRALISQGMFYNTNGISHGGGQNLIRFNANQGGSFDIDLAQATGAKALRMAIDYNPGQNSDNICRDANGQLGQVYLNPQRAFDDLFGASMLPIDQGQRQDIYAGKKSIVDHCLEDVNRIKSRLGSLGTVFDDNLAALVDLQKEITALQTAANEEAANNQAAMCQSNIQVPNGTSQSNYDAYFNVMSDIMFQYLTCTQNQVAIFQMSNAQSDLIFNFNNSPVNTNQSYHSGLVHGTNRGFEYQEIIKWYIGKVAGFARRLADSNNILADSAVLHMSEMGIADHSTRDIPFIVYGELGGTIRGNRVIQGNTSVNRFLKSATDSIFGPVVGGGVNPMNGLT